MKLFPHPFPLALIFPLVTAVACLLPISSLRGDGFVNFESPQVHPLDLSPDGKTLAVCNTAANGIVLFDVQPNGSLIQRATLFTGLDPVSLRFRTATELWVVNHISDSVSVVDLNELSVIRTLPTRDEPCDVVFAGEPRKAYVSCSAVNTIQVFDLANPAAAPGSIVIEGEDPRALAVSPDGRTVYAAVFESGNGTTILMGGFEGPTPGSAHNGGAAAFMPNLVGWTEPGVWTGPYHGQNPPPNDGDRFNPPLNPDNPLPPETGLIVKDDGNGNWFDDNGGDWTRLVAGDLSELVWRRPDWELVDNDLAVIDTADHRVSYVERMMHLCMTLAVNPVTGQVAVAGTDATNHIRFEPALKGRFIRVNAGLVDPDNPATPTVTDLNRHLDYSVSTVPQSERDKSIGDPRGIVWKPDGSAAYVTGRGSNNIVVIDSSGNRTGRRPTIEVGEGPTGVVFHESANRLFVLNQFEATVSIIDPDLEREIEKIAFFDPTPDSIKQGRKFLFDTHLTSGLGQLACASCHVDTRMDRLAWDLGDPSGAMQFLNRDNNPASLEHNLGGGLPGLTEDFTDFHPMKGPMKTQTLQDIIGHEPFHWRGDRAGIEHFNGAFQSLQGDDEGLSAREMQHHSSPSRETKF